VKVESVTIKQNGNAVTEPLALPANGNITLTAEVLPSNTISADRVITWASDAETVATVVNGVVTWVGEGTATITATAAGLKENGDPAIGTVTINATAPAGVAKLIVFNQSASPTEGTTTALPELANGRYIINNANPDAKFDSAALPNTTKDNVLVYLDTPVTGDFTLDTRLNIVEFNGVSPDAAWSGAWIGAFNAPTMNNFAEAVADSWAFIGPRKVYGGDDRMVITRNYDSDSSSASAASGTTYPTGRLYDPNSWEYEYRYTISRVGTTYTIQVKNPKTGAVLAEGTRTPSGTSYYTDILQGDVYLGVMITNCKIEISDFKVTQGANTVYQQTPTDPGPSPVTATTLELSVANAEGASGFDYVAALASVPAAGIQINAAFTPVNATDDIQWAIDPTTGASVSQTGLVTITTSGEYTITATASSPNVSAEYKIKILEVIPDVAEVIISGETEVNVGSTIKLTAEVLPVGANSEVFWESSDTAKATVVLDTGVVTGLALGTVTITAKSYNGAGDSEVTDTHEVNIIGPKEGVFFSWNAATDDALETIANNATRTISGVPVTAVGRVVTAVTEGTKGYAVANGRFAIGSDSTTATAASDTTTAGVLSLDVPFKITIVYASMTLDSPDNGLAFQVYLNNNTSNQGYSALGSGGSGSTAYSDRIWNGAEEPDGGTIVIDVDPSIYPTNADTLKTGFISLRADSHTTALITSITLEYITE
jgi:uncharacterized protein YjdB